MLNKNFVISTICLLAVVVCPYMAAADIIIDKHVDNGDDLKRFVCVMLAEGYTASEHDKFREDAADIISAFFATSPFKEYQAAINFYTLFTPSEQSGADHPSDGIYVDTAFDATYDTYGIRRLLTVNETSALQAAAEVPHFDVVFVVVNDEQYGGSGGSILVFSTHDTATEIALHEAGHVIGKLADEYETPYPGFPPGDQEPNVTFQDTREKIPWKNWIGGDTEIPTPDNTLETIGLFEGARYQSYDIFRPKHNCRMRQLNKDFCEICREALVLSLFSIVSPINSFSPATESVTLSRGTAVTFQAEPLVGDTEHLYESMWEIDDEFIETESPFTMTLEPGACTQGTTTVSLWISDLSSLVKTDPQSLLSSRQTWTVEKNFCSGMLTGTLNDTTSGLPVVDAVVTIAETGKTATNTAGGFRFSDLDCGSYTIAAEADGFASAQQSITISDGEETRMDLVLEPGEDSYYITGTITGDLTDPVSLVLTGDKNTRATTRADGTFSLGPVPPGTYRLAPQASGYRFFPISRTVTVGDQSLSDILFTASPSLFAQLSGLITGETRAGVIIRATGPKNQATVSDENGSFTFTSLPPGTYVIRPVSTGAVFDPPQREVTLSDTNPPTVRFSQKETPCPATLALSGQAQQLAKIRLFRDTVLKKSRQGRSYVSRFYLVSPEVVRILSQSESLQREARRILLQVLPVINKTRKGNRVVLSPETLNAITEFAEHLSSHGSPLLQKVIEDLLKDLKQGIQL